MKNAKCTETAKLYLLGTKMCVQMCVPYLFVYITVANTNYLLQGCSGSPQLPLLLAGGGSGHGCPSTEGASSLGGTLILFLFCLLFFLQIRKRGQAGSRLSSFPEH